MNQEARRKEQFKNSVGSLIRARRRELKMTLQETAEKSELSAAFLSQAERGKATPSIVSLINIAAALDTDIHYFITPPAAAELVRRHDRPEYIDLDSPIAYRRLDSDIRNQKMSALLMEIPAGVRLPEVHRSEGEDFFYVIEGEVEQSIGDRVFTLRKGDSAHHNTQVNHSVMNNSPAPAVILWVGTPVLFSKSSQVGD